MLSDLVPGLKDGNLIYDPGLVPKGHDRFTHLDLISVCSL